MHKIHGISLGPGDPELITVKGLRILKESDAIFFPGSLLSDGRKESYVLPILKYYKIEESKLQGFYLKMSADRTVAEETYAETAIQVAEAYKMGKKVSIVCEGDISFYASFSYLLEKLHRHHVPVELVPGINSFSLGAAKHQVPLCLQDQKVAILPREQSIENIEQALQQYDTLILMKIRSGWRNLSRHLLTKSWRYYYCERLGTENEIVTSDISALQDRDIPYFSLLIIKR